MDALLLAALPAALGASGGALPEVSAVSRAELQWRLAVDAPLPPALAPTPPRAPNYHGCLNATARSMAYCNASLSIDERVDDLIGRLGLQDQISLIGPASSWGFSPCACFTPSPKPRSSDNVGLEKVGLPTWMWLTETNSGAGGSCVGDNKCPTVFVGPQGLAASFNRTSWRHKGLVTGRETRGFVNSGTGKTGNGDLSLSVSSHYIHDMYPPSRDTLARVFAAKPEPCRILPVGRRG